MNSPLSTGVVSVLALAFASGAFAQSSVPDYYPDAYSEIVEAAADEERLLIYGDIGVRPWAPVLETCRERFPNLPEVQTLDLGHSEVFERYYTETAGGLPSADLVISIDPGSWLRFIRAGEVRPYESPELDHLPDWSFMEPGTYIYSADPTVIAWSRQYFDHETRPTGLQDLIAKMEENPANFRNKLTTYQVPEMIAIYWPYIKAQIPEGGTWKDSAAWEWLDKLGGDTQPLTSSGQMVEGIQTGQYAVAYLTAAGNPRRAALSDAGSKLLGYNYIDDGTPILLRGMAITKQASSPNAAKLLLDCIVSREGQIAVAEGDYTAYRPDTADEAKWHLQPLLDEVGEDNALVSTYEEFYLNSELQDAVVQRWREAMQVN